MRHDSETPSTDLILAASKRLEERRALMAKEKENPNALALLPNHIAVCLDCSGSMSDAFPDRNSHESRLDVANSGFQSMLAASDPKKTAYTLIALESPSRILVKKTTSYLQMQTSKVSGGGGTDGIGAIQIAKSQTPTRIVILTDGEWYAGETAFEIALRAPVIPIDTIAIGEGNDAFLQKLSQITGGIFKRVNSKEEMKSHFILLEPRNYLQISHG